MRTALTARFGIGVVAATTMLALACSSTPQSTSMPASTATSSAAAATATGTPSASSTPTSTAAASTKVSANNASRAQVQAALEAAGVSSAARWAGEVEEYRPYPTNDPTLAKLRQNLAKYNPGPGVVDAIVSALSLP